MYTVAVKHLATVLVASMPAGRPKPSPGHQQLLGHPLEQVNQGRGMVGKRRDGDGGKSLGRGQD